MPTSAPAVPPSTSTGAMSDLCAILRVRLVFGALADLVHHQRRRPEPDRDRDPQPPCATTRSPPGPAAATVPTARHAAAHRLRRPVRRRARARPPRRWIAAVVSCVRRRALLRGSMTIEAASSRDEHRGGNARPDERDPRERPRRPATGGWAARGPGRTGAELPSRVRPWPQGLRAGARAVCRGAESRPRTHRTPRTRRGEPRRASGDRERKAQGRGSSAPQRSRRLRRYAGVSKARWRG
jgi:hypothetical protein